MPADNKKAQSTSTKKISTASVQTQRVTSLEQKADAGLSTLEEAVIRMHHGISVRSNAVLSAATGDDALRRKLLAMEANAFLKTGRIHELDDVPPEAYAESENPNTRAVIDKLKDN